MSRIIAIDYGKKRTGIAVSDTLQMIANGLTTVPTHELLAFILDYVAKRTGRADTCRTAEADE